MRSKLSSFSGVHKWLMLAAFSTALAACGDDGRDPILGTEGNVALSPTVTSVTPANNATDVTVINPLITAQFSEAVNPLTTSQFTVTCASPCTSPTGTVSMNSANTMATFTVNSPAMLDPLTEYTATIHTATSSANGLSIDQPYVWSFTTGVIPDTTRPEVTVTVPATTNPGPTAVAVNTAISVEFSEDMLASTITGSTFTVTCAAPCVTPTGSVSYDAASQIATFDSAQDLEWDTTYTATIDSTVTDLAGNELAGNQGTAGTASDYVWEFTTGSAPDTTRPEVTATDPMTSSPGPTADVEVDTTVSAIFSEDMLTTTITDASFTVTCASPCTAPNGVVSYDLASRTAVFTPDQNLEWETTYTATVNRSVTDLAGNQLAGNQGAAGTASDYLWEFTTVVEPDTIRPRVTATDPLTTAPGPTTNVPINTTVSAVFSEDIQATTVSDTSFTVTCITPCVSPTGTVSYDNAARSAVFDPTQDLEWETTYTATITSSVTDLAGNQLAGNQGVAGSASNYVWEFTTGIKPDTTMPRVTLTEPLTTDPGPTANVPVNTAITAIFSEDMLATTVSGTTFTLTCETPCVSPAGDVTYVVASRSAVFSPEQNLEEDTTYTATISSAVTDVAGNQLSGNQAPVGTASDYIWMFTTVAPIATDNISVQSTDPMNAGMLAVCPNASINATFNIPSGMRLDPTTVNDMTFLVVEDADPLNTVSAESIEVDVDTGTIVTFIPLNQLAENVTYRATLVSGPDGVKDLVVPGNEMVDDYEWTFTTTAPTQSCLQPVDLRTATPFGTFGGTAGVTNQGLLTIVNGDLGTTAVSTAVTGFISEPGCSYTITPLNEGKVNGKIYTAPPPPTVSCPQDGTAVTEAIAIQARLDAESAYLALTPANMPGGQNPGNENLGNLTLAPGIYTAQSGAFSIQGGDLTLDAQGNQNAVWVFQMATTLTVGGPGADFPQSVTLINGAQAKNIFWQVGSAATINEAGGGTFKGTIIAQEGVSISTAGNVDIVTIDGRALSLGASVTMVNTVINVPAE